MALPHLGGVEAPQGALTPSRRPNPDFLALINDVMSPCPRPVLSLVLQMSDSRGKRDEETARKMAWREEEMAKCFVGAERERVRERERVSEG